MSHDSPNNLRLFSQCTVARISPVAQSKDGHLSSRRTASYFFFCFFSTLPARFQEPNSAFLWKTAVILIDEIQRCPKQSGGSPTVAHRRGAPVLSLFRRKKGARPENTRGKKKKNPDFQFKRARKAAFLYRQWESGRKPFSTLQTETILAWLFFPSSCIQL